MEIYTNQFTTFMHYIQYACIVDIHAAAESDMCKVTLFEFL